MGTNQIGRPQIAGKLRIQFQMGFFKAASTFYIQIAPDPRSQIAPTSNPWRSRRLCYHGSIALICRFHTVEACRKSHDVRLSPAFRWWKSLKIHRNEKTGWDEENNLGFIKQLFIAEKSGFCSIYSNTQLIERAFLNFMIQPLRVHWGQVVGKLGRNLIKGAVTGTDSINSSSRHKPVKSWPNSNWIHREHPILYYYFTLFRYFRWSSIVCKQSQLLR